MRQIVLAFLLLATSAFISCSSGNDSNSPPSSNGQRQFIQPGDFNNSVQNVVPVGDGSQDVYVAGQFTTYNGLPANRFIKLHPDGTMDTSFTNGFDNLVSSMVLANDGSGDLYAVGPFTQYNQQPAPGIVRLNRDGFLDAGFQPGSGMVGAALTVIAAEDGTGDIYIGGRFSSYNGISVNKLARINADGSVDAGFDVGTGFDAGVRDPNLEVRVLALASDGKLYVGGSFFNYNGTPTNGLIRVNPNGQLDLTFMVGSGIPSGGSLGVRAIVPVKDGTQDVYVGGEIPSYNGQPTPLGLIRLHVNGALDQTFTPPPIITMALVPVGDATDDLYVGGFGPDQAGTGQTIDRFVRLRRDGSLAPGFQEPRPLEASILTIVQAGDGTGDIYIGGILVTYNGIPINNATRVHADGSLVQ
jgi:hypothetical protein